jgi:preprotein translocase subunit SecA
MFKNLLGDPNARKLKKYRPDVVEINLLEEEIQQLSDEALAGKTTEFKQRIDQGRVPR